MLIDAPRIPRHVGKSQTLKTWVRYQRHPMQCEALAGWLKGVMPLSIKPCEALYNAGGGFFAVNDNIELINLKLNISGAFHIQELNIELTIDMLLHVEIGILIGAFLCLDQFFLPMAITAIHLRTLPDQPQCLDAHADSFGQAR